MFTNQRTTPPALATRWLSALRPRTLSAAVGPVALGAALAARAGHADAWVALACVVGALLLQIASNLSNDAFDHLHGVDDAARIGPARAAAMGWLTPRALLVATAVAVGLACGVGVFLVARGGWPIAAIGVSGAAAAVLYTGGPWPLGYLGLGDALVFAFFGYGAVCGTVLASGGSVDLAVVLVATGAGALATAILVVNNLRDRDGDARSGKRTLAVRLGAAATRRYYVALIVVGFAAPLLAIAWADAGLVWLLSALAWPLGLRTARRLWVGDGAALNPVLGATAGVGLVWSLCLAAAIVLDSTLARGGWPW